MFQSLIILLIFLIMCMVACVLISEKKEVQNRRSVVQLIWTAIITAVCYTTSLLIPMEQYRLAIFLKGLYYLSTDWLIIYLLLFSVAYTQVEPPSRLPRRIIGMLAGIDSISFIINTFTQHMFYLEAASDERLKLDYWKIQLKPLHSLHRFFVYVLVLRSCWAWLA